MNLKCKTIKKIPFIASLDFLVGCNTVPEPKPFTSEADKYAYVKKYMQWYIKKQMHDNSIMGISIALVDDQKIVWQEGFGYANKAKGLKATPQTRYRAGSITKLFTDMAVMKLAEEGRMNIDKPFKTYLPEFSIKSRFGSTDEITPRNIMTHHSGLPGDWLDRMWGNTPLPYTEYVNVIKNEYVAYAPNTMMSYSNLAVSLLGYSVERVSKMPYEKYIDQVLFTPLDMRYADLHMSLEGIDTAKSYKEGKETKEYALGGVPAGALNVSVEELSHLAMMINANGRYKHHQILKPSTLHQMFQVQNKDIALDVGQEIGLGYFIDTHLLGSKNTVYHHGGNTVAQNAYFTVSPHAKLGVVVMSNVAGTYSIDIARKLLEKAWEAKTGKKIPTKQFTVKHNSDFQGTFSTMLGKVTIKKDSPDTYTAYTDNGAFRLFKTKGNTYKIKYKLLGFLSIGNDDLDTIELYTDNIDGKHVIVASMNKQKFIGGVNVGKSTSIPEIWKTYMGHYAVLNNYEPKEWQIEDVEFLIEKGYPVVKVKYKSGKTSTGIIKPINDTEAITEGLGRSAQETIYFKDGIFHAQGLRFKKID